MLSERDIKLAVDIDIRFFDDREKHWKEMSEDNIEDRGEAHHLKLFTIKVRKS